jgi:hypothetical protein
MMRSVIVFLLTLGLASRLLADSEPTTIFLPETSSTLALSLIHDKEFPDEYRSIVFHSVAKTYTLIARNPIHRIPATSKERAALFWFGPISGLKTDPSRFFMIGQYSVDAKPHTLLFFFSQAYASDAAPLLIVGFADDGRPIKVFEREYELKSFEQAEGGATITGAETVQQAMCAPSDPHAPSSTTYDPYSIFLLRPGVKPLYVLDASRAYNRKHYVWAGPVSREDYAVIRNLPGHPKLFAAPVSQLDRLLGGVNCTQ